jgi:NitT/TauT family transport system substrate-binding protein
MSALGTGDLDYACSVVQGVTAAIKGIPLKLVMITQKNLVFALVVRPEVQSVADLRGKTVGISYPGSTMHLVADAIFRRHGLVPGKDVNLFRLAIIKVDLWPLKQVELTRVLATRP